jgi:hypothetical protein
MQHQAISKHHIHCRSAGASPVAPVLPARLQPFMADKLLDELEIRNERGKSNISRREKGKYSETSHTSRRPLLVLMLVQPNASSSQVAPHATYQSKVLSFTI